MTNDKTLLFIIKLDDLTLEKQDEIIEAIRPGVQELAEQGGKELLKREWHEPQPQTWQEAYVRLMGINNIMWSDYERGEVERPPDFMWETWQEEHIVGTAEGMAREALMNTKFEIEI